MERNTRQLLNIIILIGILVLLSAGIKGQSLLLLENSKNLKNFKYFTGDRIIFKISGGERKITDRILLVTDTMVVFEATGEFKFGEITCIYMENWAMRTLSTMSMIGGAAYFSIDSFNRLINHQDPVVDKNTGIISGSMIAFGLALIPLKYRKINITGNWKLKGMELDD